MTDPATMAEKKNTVTTAKAAGFGGFIDFGSYVYAGYMYQADFGETNASPGHTLIVGPGPGLLKLLADLATKK